MQVLILLCRGIFSSVHQQNLSASDSTQQGDRVIRKKKKSKVKSPRNGMITATGNQQHMNNESPHLHTDGANVEGNTSTPSQMLCMFWKTF